ncbi:hypothetical protein GCM10010420_21920 [Streptomyces glaucosporus]|uniref:PAS domain-containing protein n=1 Tax=Streptomyces glaucosporus TaxID=284044 RepID=A0ABN3I8H1_9ACTN
MPARTSAHRTLFARAWMALLVVDRSGVVVDANPSAARLTGRPLGELTGSPAHHHLPEALCVTLWSRLGSDRGAYFHATTPLGTAARNAVGGDRARVRVRVVAWLAVPGDPESEAVCCLLPLVPRPGSPALPAPPRLSTVEARIVEGLAYGLTNVELSRRLHLSRQGLDYHIDRLRRKLRVRGRTAVVARAYVAGLLAADVWPPRLRTTWNASPTGGEHPSPAG